MLTWKGTVICCMLTAFNRRFLGYVSSNVPTPHIPTSSHVW